MKIPIKYLKSILNLKKYKYIYNKNIIIILLKGELKRVIYYAVE